MSPRIFQIVVRLLVTAVTVVLALVVATTFLRIIRPPDEDALRRAELMAATTTTTTTVVGDETTTSTTSTPVTDPTETTTSTPVVDECPEPEPPDGGGTLLQIYYSCGTAVVPVANTFVYRSVPTTELVLTATLQQMVRGPTDDERTAGYTSFFSEDTADSIIGLSVLDGGRAVIDFTGLDDIDGISVPERSLFLIADLNATVFQFETINGAEYRLDGSCDAFWEMLGQDECRTYSRADWTRQLSEWRGR